MKKFYVYKVYLDGILVYVGKGQNKRCDHAISGSSSNKALNELYFRHKLLGEPLPYLVVKSCENEAEALRLEHELIYEYKPKCNCLLKYNKPYGFKYDDSEWGDVNLSDFNN